MQLLAFLGGRHNRRAWGQALFAAGCKLPEKPDVKRYEKVTAQIIENDCRIIRQCAAVILKTQRPEIRSKRKMIMFSRYSHLAHLEPYANRKQKKLIQEAKAIAARARKIK